MFGGYFKYKHDVREMIKYRDKNFRNLEAMINIHNIILERPDEVRLSVMLLSVERMLYQINFYQDEIAKIDRIVVDFKGNEERLNKYGRALMNNYIAIQDELRDIIDTLRDCISGIQEQINSKEL